MKKIHEDLITAGIAGGLVFAGAFVGSGDLELRGIIAAFAAASIVFLNKLRDNMANHKTKKNIRGYVLNFL